MVSVVSGDGEFFRRKGYRATPILRNWTHFLSIFTGDFVRHQPLISGGIGLIWPFVTEEVDAWRATIPGIADIGEMKLILLSFVIQWAGLVNIADEVRDLRAQRRRGIETPVVNDVVDPSHGSL